MDCVHMDYVYLHEPFELYVPTWTKITTWTTCTYMDCVHMDYVYLHEPFELYVPTLTKSTIWTKCKYMDCVHMDYVYLHEGHYRLNEPASITFYNSQ